MPFRLFFYDHNAYHRRFRGTWLQREKEATRPFTFQAKVAEMDKNQYKSELLIRSHPRGRGFESLQVHQNENRPKGRFSFCRGPAGVEVYPPLAGEIPSGPPKINHPQGWIYFCRGPAGVEVYPPCGGNPFRSTKNKPTRRGGFIFAAPCQCAASLCVLLRFAPRCGILHISIPTSPS